MCDAEAKRELPQLCRRVTAEAHPQSGTLLRRRTTSVTLENAARFFDVAIVRNLRELACTPTKRPERNFHLPQGRMVEESRPEFEITREFEACVEP